MWVGAVIGDQGAWRPAELGNDENIPSVTASRR